METLIRRIPEKVTRTDLTDQLDTSINETRKLCAKFNVDSSKCPQPERHGFVNVPNQRPLIQMQSKIEEEWENFRIIQQLRECKELRKS